MSISSLKREVTDLKQSFPKMEIINVLSYFPWREDQPHDCFGRQLLTFTKIGKKTTLTYNLPPSNIKDGTCTKQEYAELNEKHHFDKNPTHVWCTYDKWVAYHLCRCGKHGVNRNKPYLGDKKNGTNQ